MSMNHTPPFIYDNDAPGKALILREGLRLFAYKGLSGTSIRDIATATGLSNPALYKHFKTKEELATVLFERLYRSHLLRLTTTINTEPDFQRKFHAFLEIRLSAFSEQPDAAIFVTDNLITLWPQMPKDMKAQTILTLLRKVVQLGRSEGIVDSDADLDLQLSAIVGMLDNIMRQIFFSSLPSPALERLDQVEQILRKALR